MRKELCILESVSACSLQGILLALSGKPAEAILDDHPRSEHVRVERAQLLGLSLAVTTFRRAAYAELGQFDDAWRCVNEAITAVEATKGTWCEAESHRVAGEIALKSPEANVPNAQAHFERALAVARAQQAKSWELRAAMSMARLLSRSGQARMRPAISSLRYMAGSLKASTRFGTSSEGRQGVTRRAECLTQNLETASTLLQRMSLEVALLVAFSGSSFR